MHAELIKDIAALEKKIASAKDVRPAIALHARHKLEGARRIVENDQVEAAREAKAPEVKTTEPAAR